MKITITINCDNAAFEDRPEDEIRRILAEPYYLQKAIIEGSSALHDSNGNRVGTITRTGRLNRHREVGSV